MIAMYQRMRRPVHWDLDANGRIIRTEGKRGPIEALVALRRYGRINAKIPF